MVPGWFISTLLALGSTDACFEASATTSSSWRCLTHAKKLYKYLRGRKAHQEEVELDGTNA